MENLNLILFLSIAAPLAMMLAVCQKRSRSVLLFLLIGICVCLFSSEFSGILFSILPFSSQYLTINITPFSEEILKAIPLLIFVFMYEPEDKYIFECSIAIGVGFAILENAFILSQNINAVSIPLALIRGFGAGMMHGLCTFTVGFGLSFIRRHRKLFVCGTAAIIGLAVMFHALYNILVQSRYQFVGYAMPMLIFVPLMIQLKVKKQILSD